MARGGGKGMLPSCAATGRDYGEKTGESQEIFVYAARRILWLIFTEYQHVLFTEFGEGRDTATRTPAFDQRTKRRKVKRSRLRRQRSMRRDPFAVSSCRLSSGVPPGGRPLPRAAPHARLRDGIMGKRDGDVKPGLLSSNLWDLECGERDTMPESRIRCE